MAGAYDVAEIMGLGFAAWAVQNDHRASVGQRRCDAKPDAARGSGDDSHTTVERAGRWDTDRSADGQSCYVVHAKPPGHKRTIAHTRFPRGVRPIQSFA